MSRLLFIIVLLVVSFLILKSVRKKIDTHNNNKLDKSSDSEKMLKCQHCGLHVPEQEALRQGEKVFCSLEHARQYLE